MFQNSKILIEINIYIYIEDTFTLFRDSPDVNVDIRNASQGLFVPRKPAFLFFVMHNNSHLNIFLLCIITL